MQLAVTDVKHLALRIKLQAFGQGELDGLFNPRHFAHRDRTQRLDALNHLIDQNLGRRCTSRQTDF